MPNKFVEITRDSVAAGDDVDAPHAKTCGLNGTTDLKVVLKKIVDDGYLAHISGGKAAWVAKADGVPVAVVAQQWSEPRLLETKLSQLSAVQRLHFFYLGQKDPASVYSDLNG